MKILSYILFIIALGFISTGVYYDIISENHVLKDQFYGIGSLILFFVAIPVFLFSRRKSKSWEKYKWNQDEFEEYRKSNKF